MHLEYGTVEVPTFAVIDLKDATISINGSGGDATLKIGEGNFTYSEKRNIEFVRDRGLLDNVREGDEEPIDVKIDAVWEFFSSSGSGIEGVEDAIKGVEGVTDSECNPYNCDITVSYESTCEGGSFTINLDQFYWEEFAYDIKAGTISISGKCNISRASRS